MPSCTSVIGLVILVTTLIVAAVSFSTPRWVVGSEKDPQYHAGLWQTCKDNECKPLYNATSLPKWFRGCQIGFGVSVATVILSMLVAMSYLCCNCCQLSLRAVQFNVIILVLAAVEAIGVVVVFALKRKEMPFHPIEEKDLHLGWSFYMAVGSTAAVILNIFFYVCETSYARARVDYQPIRPTSEA